MSAINLTMSVAMTVCLLGARASLPTCSFDSSPSSSRLKKPSDRLKRDRSSQLLLLLFLSKNVAGDNLYSFTEKMSSVNVILILWNFIWMKRYLNAICASLKFKYIFLNTLTVYKTFSICFTRNCMDNSPNDIKENADVSIFN